MQVITDLDKLLIELIAKVKNGIKKLEELNGELENEKVDNKKVLSNMMGDIVDTLNYLDDWTGLDEVATTSA